MIAWTRVHEIDAPLITAIASNVHNAATWPAKEKSRGNIVPHGGKRKNRRAENVGRNNVLALLPQYTHQGLLTRGPFTCQPLTSHVAPPGCPRRPMWPLPRVRAAYVLRGPPQLYHVILRVASHPRGSPAMSAYGSCRNYPLFYLLK